MKQVLIFKDPSLSLMQMIKALFSLQKIKLSAPICGQWLWGSTASYCLTEWLKNQKIPKGANVCCPAYICDSIVAPLICSEVEVRFYTLNDDLTPNMNNVLALTDCHTWAWIGVNYFGFPTMTDEFITEGRKRGILIFEDNAHGWFSHNGIEQLGFRGDIGIFSPRKTYPLPDGGCIWIRDSINAATTFSISEENASIGKNHFRFLIKRLIWNIEEKTELPLYKFLIKRGAKRQRCKQKIKGKRKSFSLQGRKISSISARLFNVLKNGDILTLRRSNYQFWLNSYHRLQSICGKFFPLFPELKDGVCPLVFPVLVQDPCNFEDGSLQLGIETVPWPGRENLPPEVRNSAAGVQADYLAGHIWTLPVHQTVNIKVLSQRVRNIA